MKYFDEHTCMMNSYKLLTGKASYEELLEEQKEYKEKIEETIEEEEINKLKYERNIIDIQRKEDEKMEEIEQTYQKLLNHKLLEHSIH